MESLKLKIEKLEERIAPWASIGAVAGVSIGVGAIVGVGGGGSCTGSCGCSCT